MSDHLVGAEMPLVEGGVVRALVMSTMTDGDPILDACLRRMSETVPGSTVREAWIGPPEALSHLPGYTSGVMDLIPVKLLLDRPAGLVHRWARRYYFRWPLLCMGFLEWWPEDDHVIYRDEWEGHTSRLVPTDDTRATWAFVPRAG